MAFCILQLGTSRARLSEYEPILNGRIMNFSKLQILEKCPGPIYQIPGTQLGFENTLICLSPIFKFLQQKGFAKSQISRRRRRRRTNSQIQIQAGYHTSARETLAVDNQTKRR